MPTLLTQFSPLMFSHPLPLCITEMVTARQTYFQPMFTVIVNQDTGRDTWYSGSKPDEKNTCYLKFANKPLWNNNNGNNNYVIVSRKVVLQDTCHVAQSFHFQKEMIGIIANSYYTVLKNKPTTASVISSAAAQNIFCASFEKTDEIQRLKPRDIITFGPNHPDVGTIAQVQHCPGIKNPPTTKGRIS